MLDLRPVKFPVHFHVGDHIAYLHEGRIYFYGTPAEIQASPDPLIQDFLLGRASRAD